jgi:hypothetical protein
MDALQRLVDLEALRHLKASYWYYLDTKDWESWLDLFTPDASLAWDAAASVRGKESPLAGRHVGRDAIRKNVVEALLDPAQTVHMGHAPVLEVTSENTATGIWPLEDIVNHPSGSITHGYGHYRETYKKVDGKWKIASLHLTRLRVENTSL